MMRRPQLPLVAFGLPCVARAHGSGIEIFYAGAELLLLLVMLVVIVALRAPWRRQIAALLVLIAATALAIAFAHIPTDSVGAWLGPVVVGCIPFGSMCALVIVLRRAAPGLRR